MHTEIGCSKTVNLTQSESFDTLSPLEMNLLVSALEKAKHEPFFGYIGNAFQLEEDSFKLRSCSYQHIIDVIKDVAKEMFANDISLNETEQADAMKGGGHDEQAD
jgi:hypothetical protein